MFLDGDNPTSYTMLSGDITLNNPSKTWYTFLWRSGTNIDWLSINVVIPSDSVWNRVFEAVWEVNSYTITYDIDWKNKNIVTWDYNSDIVKPQDPERNWYKFLSQQSFFCLRIFFYVCSIKTFIFIENSYINDLFETIDEKIIFAVDHGSNCCAVICTG